ncbi:DUF4249 family protein [Pedobacter sp. NJ-S-72]
MKYYSTKHGNFKLGAGLLTGFLSLSLLSACEKVIDLKLDNVAPVIVIDGGVNDLNENQLVRISKTYSFTDANKFNGISGAKVVLTASNGTSVNYTAVSPGVYSSPKFKGIPGTTYKLTVDIEGKTYTASSTMPKKVILNLLTFKDITIAGKKKKYVAVIYDDPPGVPNFYNSIIRFKGIVKFDAATDDRFNDGMGIKLMMYFFTI